MGYVICRGCGGVGQFGSSACFGCNGTGYAWEPDKADYTIDPPFRQRPKKKSSDAKDSLNVLREIFEKETYKSNTGQIGQIDSAENPKSNGTQKRANDDAFGVFLFLLIVPLIVVGCAGLVVGYILFFGDMVAHRLLYNAHIRQERHYLDRHKNVQPEKQFLSSLEAKGRAFLHLGIGIGAASLFFARIQAEQPPWSDYHMEPFQAWFPYGFAGVVIGVAFTVRRSLIAYHQHLRKTGEIF